SAHVRGPAGGRHGRADTRRPAGRGRRLRHREAHVKRYTDDEWSKRLESAQATIDVVLADMTSIALAEGIHEDSGPWTDRVYERLEAMTPHDLALVVVVSLHERATEEANRLWSAIHTMIPEDVI